MVSTDTVTPYETLCHQRDHSTIISFFFIKVWHVFPFFSFPFFLFQNNGLYSCTSKPLEYFCVLTFDVAPQSCYSSVEVSYAHPVHCSVTASFDRLVVRNAFELCLSIYCVVATLFKRKACLFSRKVHGYFINFIKKSMSWILTFSANSIEQNIALMS